MSNEEIPSKLWELKNDAIHHCEQNISGNRMNSDYKGDWEYVGRRLQEIGKAMEELAKQFVQPKED